MSEKQSGAKVASEVPGLEVSIQRRRGGTDLEADGGLVLGTQV